MKSNNKDQTQMNEKLIDEVIRRSYGFSDEQLQAELDDAIAHPDTSPKLQAPADEFQTILRKMEERGLRPFSEQESEDETHTDSENLEDGAEKIVPEAIKTGKTVEIAAADKKRFSARKIRRILLAAAALGMIGVGFSLNAVGKSATKYRVIDGEENNIVWNNVKEAKGVKDVNGAYTEIEKELNIPVLRLGYIPAEMEFEKLAFAQKCAIIRFKYQNQYIHVYQWKIDSQKFGVYGRDEKNKISEVYNPWLNITIETYQEISDNGYEKYCMEIKEDDAAYYVSGTIDEPEFSKIIESLYTNN